MNRIPSKYRLAVMFFALALISCAMQACGPAYSDTSDVRMASGNKRTHLGASRGGVQGGAAQGD